MRNLLRYVRQKLGLTASSPAAEVTLMSASAEGESSAIENANRLIESGNALEDRGAFADAVVQYQAALGAAPNYWRAHMNLGNAYLAQDSLEQAYEHYLAARDQKPEHYGTWYNLGMLLSRVKRQDEAAQMLQEAIRLKPDAIDAMIVLANAYEEQSNYSECLSWLDKALLLAPAHDGALLNKAACLSAMGRVDQAEEVALVALNLPDARKRALSCLSSIAEKKGESRKSLEYIQRNLETQAEVATVDSYLMTLAYVDGVDQRWLCEEHRRYQHIHGQGVAVSRKPRGARQKLRVGFVSPDFRHHAVVFFVERLFALLNRERFEVFAYYSYNKSDALTERIAQLCDGWRTIFGAPARAVAEAIAEDQVDILIDLAGHTNGNRLDVFALKPAPVQATWLGYLATSGLDAMDYRIVDGYTDPVGMTEAFHVERLIRLPHSQWCYQPRAGVPDVSPLPALDNGYITFASFNNAPKLSERTLALWGELLASIPNSRLLIATVPSGQARQRISSLFEAKGVCGERLEFLERAPWLQYFETYSRVDIALDTFPYHGGTTTCDALYMGVPVLTLAGQHSVARSGVSLASNVGLPDWVAPSPEAYLSIGQQKCADLAALAALRAVLRERFLASPLGDQEAFAKDFAVALETMWQEKMGNTVGDTAGATPSH